MRTKPLTTAKSIKGGKCVYQDDTPTIKICPYCLKEILRVFEIRPGLYRAGDMMYDGKGGYFPVSHDPHVQAAREAPGWFEEHHYQKKCGK
jgi:hypothetical protein